MENTDENMVKTGDENPVNRTSTKTKKYNVSLTRYPTEFEVEATSKEEAVLEARRQFPHVVWESEVREVN